MRAALFGMIHVNLHKGYIAASSVYRTLPHLLSKWVSKLSFYLGCAKSQNLARLREIAKINTRKIIGIPKSQNFVLANNSNIKVQDRRLFTIQCSPRISTSYKFAVPRSRLPCRLLRLSVEPRLSTALKDRSVVPWS